jgi:hypothetical protein
MAVAIPANIGAMTALVEPNPEILAPLSISERYEHPMAMLCLLDRLGCGPKERFRLLHDGFDTISSLVNHYGGDVEEFKKHLTTNNKNWIAHAQTMMRAFFTPIVINKLVGTLYYLHTSVQLFHAIPDVQLITSERATQYGTLFNNSTSTDDDDDADKVDVPSFQDAKGWMSFKENFILLLGLTKGVRGIPLDYIIDNTPRTATRANANRIEIEEIDLQDESIFKRCTVHFGDSFKLDNKTVWNKLHTLLVDKPGYNHISSFALSKNGRNAWHTLITYYEGEDFQQRLRETAFLKLQNTFYRGETNRFNFEKYTNIHLDCHKMLQDAKFNAGLGLDNESKITYFRNGIKSEAGLEIAISNSRSNPRLHTFDSLVSFFTAEVQHNSLRRKQLKSSLDKKVSAANRDKNKNNPTRPPKGNKNGPILSEIVDGKKMEGRWYNPDDFSKFTPKQRAAVIKLKRRSAQGSDTPNAPRNQIQSLRREFQDDMVTLGNAIISGVNHAAADNAQDDLTVTTGSTASTTSTRQTAESGSIGNIFKNRRKRPRNED